MFLFSKIASSTIWGERESVGINEHSHLLLSGSSSWENEPAFKISGMLSCDFEQTIRTKRVPAFGLGHQRVHVVATLFGQWGLPNN